MVSETTNVQGSPLAGSALNDCYARHYVNWFERCSEELGLETSALERLRKACLHAGTRERHYDPAVPHQRPRLFVPGLDAGPFFDRRRVALTSVLEAKAEAIAGELRAAHGHPAARNHHEHDELVSAGDWRELRLFQYGYEIAAHTALFPGTAGLLRNVDRLTGRLAGAWVAIMEAGTDIASHYGPHNLHVRQHLCLSDVASCALRVGDETRAFTKYGCFAFDHSFSHSAHNHDPEGRVRVVLIVDLWHHDLTPFEVVALRYAEQHLGEVFATGLLSEQAALELR